MNKQPVYYMQTDPQWRSKPYRVPGENSTVGNSGCGPSCCSMVIETLTGKKFTPLDACNWSLQHGYKALNQGTYLSYVEAQLKAEGIDCKMLNWQKTYGKPDHKNHEEVFKLIKEGYYAIALMGKGNWTSSGHFVLIWWVDDKVRINDPYSKKDSRLNGDLKTFKSQVKYYWIIDARSFNKEEEEQMKVYKYVDEVPQYARSTIEKLMEAKLLSGTGIEADTGKVVLNLSDDLVRSIILTYRGGGFDKKLIQAGLEPAVK